MENENMLVRIVHKGAQGRKGKKIGVVVAVGPNQIGWALCRKTDVFNASLGVRIAEGRARSLEEIENRIPFSLRKIVLNMADRSVRYFK